MIRAEAVARVLDVLNSDDIVIAADGAISREAYRHEDRSRTFYMLGSMGQVASVALGLALTRSERVIALDGDGNLMMGFGGLAMVGGLKPKNLYHVVLDNGCYDTTGGQVCMSRRVDLAEAARGCGYQWAEGCAEASEIAGFLEHWLAASAPALLRLAIEPGDPDPAPRIPMTPEEMAAKLRSALV